MTPDNRRTINRLIRETDALDAPRRFDFRTWLPLAPLVVWLLLAPFVVMELSLMLGMVALVASAAIARQDRQRSIRSMHAQKEREEMAADIAAARQAHAPKK